MPEITIETQNADRHALTGLKRAKRIGTGQDFRRIPQSDTPAESFFLLTLLPKGRYTTRIYK
jgi:hypothetical protein